jgi:hypothetical protein
MTRPLVPLVALLIALPALGDSDVSREALREYAVQLINRDRVKQNLRPVELDPEISRIADRRALEVLRGEELDEPVYVRYSREGTDDSVNENVHAWSVTYPLTPHALRELTRKSQISMMDEKAPVDGRKAAILDVLATHAAVGFAWYGHEFRIVQVFIRRYVHFAVPMARCATTADTVHVSGWPGHDTTFDAITVHYEPPPHRRTKKVARSLIMTHALPRQRKEYLSRLGSTMKRYDDGKVAFFRFQYGPGRHGEVEVGDWGEFSFDMPFTEGPGTYTVVVWVRFLDRAEGFPATMTSIVVEAPPVVTAAAAASPAG